MTTQINTLPQDSQPEVSPGIHFVEFSEDDTQASIGDLFQRTVTDHGQKLALCAGQILLSYEDLYQLASEISRTVQAHNSVPEKGVALLLGHSVDMVASILGVLMSGNHYVPLDTKFPESRNSFILEDSGCDLVITNGENLEAARRLAGASRTLINIDEISPSESEEPGQLRVKPEALAYIIYTSGSTGQPKGVMQTHQSVLRVTRRYTNGIKVSSDDRVTHLASFSVTASVANMLSALLNGASLYLYNLLDDGIGNLGSWITRNNITVYHSVASVLRGFAATLPEQKRFPSLRILRLGGDRVFKSDVEQYKKHFHDGCLMINGYGSSEISSVFQYCIDKHTIIEGDNVPVGWPLDDTQCVLLDEDGQEVCGGATGEIVLKSPYLTSGYWNQPELTASVFKPDPNDGTPTYHTGDMGYLLPNGCLVHKGRKDFQTKIRGFRVELGEIERTLGSHPTVKDAVLTTQTGPSSEIQLLAYVVPVSSADFNSDELRAFARAKLPEYMVPAFFSKVYSIPVTPNGKVDRQALPALEDAIRESENGVAEDSNETEQAITKIWCEALEIKYVGLDDNFFDHGGSSLSANLVVSRIRDTLGVQISLRAFFEAPTIRELAAELPR
jgi:amino acid adenylation domain-containing protein